MFLHFHIRTLAYDYCNIFCFNVCPTEKNLTFAKFSIYYGFVNLKPFQCKINFLKCLLLLPLKIKVDSDGFYLEIRNQGYF